MEMFSMTVAEPTIKEIEPLSILSIREKETFEEVIPQLIGILCTYFSSPQSR
jgi:effector-binding domain-containing protein